MAVVVNIAVFVTVSGGVIEAIFIVVVLVVSVIRLEWGCVNAFIIVWL